ncbi:MAG: hypothetical protein DWP98_11810 [Bacteroidetes bacterium]|nr:MAG: hypothetical protein DWP98_11750 [Bacteroidota bacterium]KAA3645191.1 MAG: hypothetical protein DWP98_11810 [Bacteroidota bacterium]MBL1144074.1 hypothetical protein [Bacteroidota bacterium]
MSYFHLRTHWNFGSKSIVLGNLRKKWHNVYKEKIKDMIKIKRIEGIEFKLPSLKVMIVLLITAMCYFNKDYISIIEIIKQIVK